MSANGEGLGRILTVALGLCLVCSVVVSTAAVVLKPAQQANKTLDLKRNILMAAGLILRCRWRSSLSRSKPGW